MGISKGIGTIMDMQVYWRQQTHPGVPVIKQLQPFAACAQYLYPNSDTYDWFVAASCMDSGQTSYSSCVSKANIPSKELTAITICMKNTTESGNLVKEMNAKAANNPGSRWPWVIVDGVTMPEPDEHGDDPTPMIDAICKDFSGTNKPAACSAVLFNTTNAYVNTTVV